MRRTPTHTSLAVAGLTFGPLVGISAVAAAQGDTIANLRPVAVRGSQASGTAMAEVNGNRNDVHGVSGLLADHPHAARIYFGADARRECPTR